MDLRLLDEIVAFMGGIGLTNRYDHLILAGASLGATYEGVPHWGQTFWDHLDLARSLHDVREVFILEHRQCGAYAKILGQVFSDDDDPAEAAAHAEVVFRLKTEIQVRHPELSVRSFLMGLRGDVIELLV